MRVDKDKVCEFCEYSLSTDPNTCEGRFCDEAKEGYCEKVGVSEEVELFFDKMHVKQGFYTISLDDVIPKIYHHKVKRVSLYKGFIRIDDMHDNPYEVPIKFVNVSWCKLSGTRYIFLDKSDCDRVFDELCVQRITELSKAMGDTKRVQ